MKYGAITVLVLKTEDILENIVLLQLGGKAPEFRINDKTRCTDRDPSAIR
jgi:hypothetical protein